MPKIIYLFILEHLQLQEESKKWNSVFIKNVLDFLSFQELYLIQIQKQLFLENQKFIEYYYERKPEHLQRINATFFKKVKFYDAFFIHEIHFENCFVNFRLTFELTSTTVKQFYIDISEYKFVVRGFPTFTFGTGTNRGPQYKNVISLTLDIYPQQQIVQFIIHTDSQTTTLQQNSDMDYFVTSYIKLQLLGY